MLVHRLSFMVGVSGYSVVGSVLDVTEAAIRDGSFEHN